MRKDKEWAFLYVLNCNNLYKIGVSKNVERRIKQLTKMPYPITCEFKWWCRNPYQIEALFHDLLSEKRINGEWFELDMDDLDYIRYMMSFGL